MWYRVFLTVSLVCVAIFSAAVETVRVESAPRADRLSASAACGDASRLASPDATGLSRPGRRHGDCLPTVRAPRGNVRSPLPGRSKEAGRQATVAAARAADSRHDSHRLPQDWSSYATLQSHSVRLQI